MGRVGGGGVVGVGGVLLCDRGSWRGRCGLGKGGGGFHFFS